MWALLLLPVVLAALYFVQRFLFRRLWDKNLSVQISFDRDYVFCGEEANLVETIVNNKYLPLPVLEVGFDMSRWVVFQDEENSTVSDMTYRRDVFTASVRQRITRTLPVRGKKRGYYRIASTTVTSYDLLMTEKQVAHFPQETEFYVLPAHISANRIHIPYSKITGLLVSRRRVYDDPFEFAGIRDYRRSDPMKYINWKASARGGSLLVNQHDSTLSQRVTVILDCSGIGSAVTDTLNETGISIAAELCERMLADGISVSVVSNGTDILDQKPLSTGELTGRNTALYLRRQLARVQCRNDLPPVSDVLHTLRSGAHDNNLYVLISKEQKLPVLPELEALTEGSDAIWILPENRNMPERNKLTETSKTVEIVRWEV